MSATLQTEKLSAYFNGCPVATIGSTCYPVREFYLEDALLQTSYLEKLGLGKGAGGDRAGQPPEQGQGKEEGSQRLGGREGAAKPRGEDPLLRTLCEAKAVYTCEMCGQRGFRSPEEFGTHVVLCDGAPVGGAGEEGAGHGYEALEAKLLEGLEGEDDFVPDYEDWTETPGQLGPADLSAALAKDVDAPEGFVSAVEDPGEGEGLGCEGGGGRPPYRHRASEGEGVLFPMPSLTEVQAQEALRAYQYAFDDENVDYDLILQLLHYIDKSGYGPGAILVFLPGWDDISRLRDALRQDPDFGNAKKAWVLPLHSGVPSQQQREVFKSPPPGVRKVVLATNIAETSVTIDDVVFVVDSGRVKEKTYDPFLKLCTLQPTWISKASARQRRGRAGRVRAGVCFHLCSRRRFESLKEFKESELLTTPLEELCLQAKLLGLAPGFDPYERQAPPAKSKTKPAMNPELLAALSLEDGEGSTAEENGAEKDPDISRLEASRLEGDSIMRFLGKALDAPHDLSVKNAIDLLMQIGAFTAQEQLTDLGMTLARLPMDPRIGKMVLWGQMLGCGGAALKVACALAYRDPFVLPLTAEMKVKAKKAKQELAVGTMSDHLALLSALQGYEAALARGGQQAAFGYCDRYFLSRSTLSTALDVAKQMVRELVAMGFDPSLFSNAREGSSAPSLALLTAVLCAGLYPGVACRRVGEVNFTTSCQKKAKLHQSSVNYHPGSRFTRVSTPESHRALGGGPEFLVFSEVVRTPSIFVISNTTPVPVLSVFLLCGDSKVRGIRTLLEGQSGVRRGEDATARKQSGGSLVQDNEGATGVEETENDEDDEAGLGDEALLLIDEWMTFRCPKEVALHLQVLRLRLEEAFLAFLKHPQGRLSSATQDALQVAVRLFALENPYITDDSLRQGHGRGYRGGSPGVQYQGRGGRQARNNRGGGPGRAGQQGARKRHAVN